MVSKIAHTRKASDNNTKLLLNKSAESPAFVTPLTTKPLEDELFHRQRAAFLDVPIEVLQSKRQFDLIKLLRKRRNERLAREEEEEEEAQSLVEPGTMIKVHIQTMITENLIKDSTLGPKLGSGSKKKVLKKRRVPRKKVAVAAIDSSSATKTVRNTRPKNFVFQEDHQTDAHKAILEKVVPTVKMENSEGGNFLLQGPQRVAIAAPVDCFLSEADSDLLTSFESDSESDEFFKAIATESTQTGGRDPSTSSANSEESGSDDCHTEADEECFYKKFAAGQTRALSVVEKECQIPVRDLVKIVPCEVLGTELFKQVRLAQPLSLSDLMKVANEEWKCLADIDCPEARAEYFATN